MPSTTHTTTCRSCGSDDLLYGVDEHDLEDGSYECEACGFRGSDGREYTPAEVEAEAPSAPLAEARRLLVVTYDVTGLTEAEVECLVLEAGAQGDYSRSDDYSAGHPSVPVEFTYPQGEGA